MSLTLAPKRFAVFVMLEMVPQLIKVLYYGLTLTLWDLWNFQ